MKRLQKKCLVASFGIHGLLLIIMVVAPAFLTKPEEKKVVTPPMQLISGALVAKALAPPPAPVPPAPTPRPTPPQPKPTPKKATPKPEPKPKPVVKKPEPKKTTPKPKPTPKKKTTPKKATPKKKVTKPRVTVPKPKIKIADISKLTSRKDPAQERLAREARERERKEAARREAQRVAALKRQLNSATSLSFSPTVNVRASGSSNRATIDYGNYVKGIYDQRWREPRDLTKRLTVTITVTISRSGSVLSARISRGSGVSRMDSSVQSLLNSVRKFKAFPSGMSESKKTYTIDFSIRER